MFKYTESEVIPNNIFVFGCGGTGSRMIPPLLQLIKSQSNWILNPSIYLIDGDEVEEKNCSRQNFIRMDVHQNKAEVLATRYSRGFDMLVKFYPKFFDTQIDDCVSIIPEPTYSGFVGLNRNHEKEGDLFKMVSYLTDKSGKELRNLIKSARSEYLKPGSIINSRTESKNADAIMAAKSVIFDPCIVILCVDSAQARRNILYQMSLNLPGRKVFVIDAGNEDIFGQVMFYRLDHRVSFNDGELLKRATEMMYPVSTVPSGMKDILSKVGLKAYPSSSSGDLYPYAPHQKQYLDTFFETRRYSSTTTEVKDMREELKNLGIDISDSQDLKTLMFDGLLLPEVSSVDASLNILPCPDLFYDNLQDGEGTRSCADLDQTLAINNLMAAAIINVVQNLVYGLAFDFHTIRISLNGGYYTEKMTPYWLRGMVLGLDNNYSSFITRKYMSMLSGDRIPKEEAMPLLMNLLFNRNCGFANQANDINNHLFGSTVFRELSTSENKRVSALFQYLTGRQPSQVTREEVEKHLQGLQDEEIESLASLIFISMSKGSYSFSPANYSGSLLEMDNIDSTAILSVLLYGEVKENPITMTHCLNGDKREILFRGLAMFVKRAALRGEVENDQTLAGKKVSLA